MVALRTPSDATPEPLLASSTAMLDFVAAVDSRYRELCDLYLRVRGSQLSPPKDLMPDIVKWRFLFGRYAKGDFRHRTSEVEAMKAVADWTLAIKAELTGQPVKKVAWR